MTGLTCLPGALPDEMVGAHGKLAAVEQACYFSVKQAWKGMSGAEKAMSDCSAEHVPPRLPVEGDSHSLAEAALEASYDSILITGSNLVCPVTHSVTYSESESV